MPRQLRLLRLRIHAGHVLPVLRQTAAVVVAVVAVVLAVAVVNGAVIAVVAAVVIVAVAVKPADCHSAAQQVAVARGCIEQQCAGTVIQHAGIGCGKQMSRMQRQTDNRQAGGEQVQVPECVLRRAQAVARVPL